jgi:hypothetical protein
MQPVLDVDLGWSGAAEPDTAVGACRFEAIGDYPRQRAAQHSLLLQSVQMGLRLPAARRAQDKRNPAPRRIVRVRPVSQ